MSAPQPNTPLTPLLSGLKAKHVATEAAFEQLNKAVGDFLLGEPTDPEALHALVDRCECAYVDVATDADEAIRALLHVHAPLPLAGIEEPSDLEAMDQAVDRLASTEAQALAAYGVLDATVRQLVASLQANDAPARTAGFVSDTLQALSLAGQQLETYQDAADDVVVTAGAAIGAMDQPPPEDDPLACYTPMPKPSPSPAPASAAAELTAFDAALEAVMHVVDEQEITPALFEAEFEQRFAHNPADLAWSRPIFAVMRERLQANGGLFDRVNDLVAAAADVFDRLGVPWRASHGLTAEAVAQSGDITCAFLNARARQRHPVQGLGG